MTATLDRLSNGRLLINVVNGGDPVRNARDGIHLDHAERYEVTRELLGIDKALLAGETLRYDSRHSTSPTATSCSPTAQENGAPLYFRGSSDATTAVASGQIDTHLIWGEPAALRRDKIDGALPGPGRAPRYPL